MTLQSLLPILLFAVVATTTPGAATALATASGASFGFKRSVPLLAGVGLGLATLAAAAASGLAGLLLAAPFLHLFLKIAGSAYLLWLATQIGRKGRPHPATDLAAPTSLVGGACLQWLNPKAWAMTLGAAASFATLASGPGELALLLGTAFGLTGILSMALWCTAGLMLSRLLQSDLQWRVLNISLGLLLAISIVPMWRA
ncbi:MAG: LysE family transporter [Rhodospirillaceae bacterium]|nr:LysE family transporter [Rhodospirillaceae bacterium]